MQKFNVEIVSWQSHQADLIPIRQQVFVEEQEVDPDFEWDEIDSSAVHLLIKVDQLPVACARVIQYKKIGRMAVLKTWRGKGLGMAILESAIEVCKNHGTKSIFLTAQTHAIDFYKRAGFVEISGVYQDANIPHVDMRLDL